MSGEPVTWRVHLAEMKMTKARALEIQAQQVDHYGKFYGRERVAALVAAATTADALPDGEHDVVLINEHIPRGAAIEWLIPEIREREAAHQARMRAAPIAEPRRKGIY